MPHLPMTVPARRGKLLLIAAGCLLTAFLGVVNILGQTTPFDWSNLTVKGQIVRSGGALMLVVGGTLTVVLGGLAMSRRPLLVIDVDGLELVIVPWQGAERVRWSEISRVAVTQDAHGNKYVGIELNSPDEFMAERGFLVRWSVRTGLAMGLPPLALAQDAIVTPVEDLALLLARELESRRT